MCRLIVKPTTVSVAPPWTRCTGVIAISATMVAWLSDTVRMATRTRVGLPGPTAIRGPLVGVRSGTAASVRLTSSGSGRIQIRYAAAASS